MLGISGFYITCAEKRRRCYERKAMTCPCPSRLPVAFDQVSLTLTLRRPRGFPSLEDISRGYSSPSTLCVNGHPAGFPRNPTGHSAERERAANAAQLVRNIELGTQYVNEASLQ